MAREDSITRLLVRMQQLAHRNIEINFVQGDRTSPLWSRSIGVRVTDVPYNIQKWARSGSPPSNSAYIQNQNWVLPGVKCYRASSMQVSIASVTHATRYRLLNHTRLGALLLQAQQKLIAARDKGRFVFVGGNLMLVCQVNEQKKRNARNVAVVQVSFVP